jgi:hypothetical protein
MLHLANLKPIPRSSLRQFVNGFSRQYYRHLPARRFRSQQQHQYSHIAAMSDSNQDAIKRQRSEEEALQNKSMAIKMLEFINSSVTQYHAVGKSACNYDGEIFSLAKLTVRAESQII